MILEKDLVKDEKLSIEQKALMGEGREDRDLKISEINTEIKKLAEPLNAACLANDIPEISNLRERISKLNSQKWTVGREWQNKADKLSADRNLLAKDYLSDMVNRDESLIRLCLRNFDFSTSVEKNYNVVLDKKEYRVSHNRDAILSMVERLLSIKKTLLSPMPTLREKSKLLAEVEEAIPRSFEMIKSVVDSQELGFLKDFRSMVDTGLKEIDEAVSFKPTPGAPPFWGIPEMLREYWKK